MVIYIYTENRNLDGNLCYPLMDALGIAEFNDEYFYSYQYDEGYKPGDLSTSCSRKVFNSNFARYGENCLPCVSDTISTDTGLNCGYYNSGLRLIAGYVMRKTPTNASCLDNEVFQELGWCNLPPPQAPYYRYEEDDGSSSYTLTIDCQGNGKAKLLTIDADNGDLISENPLTGGEFLMNGVALLK